MALLRSLRLSVVGAMLLACVATILVTIWRLLPMWLAYRERAEIEPQLRQISLGSERRLINQLFPGQIHFEMSTDIDADRLLRCEPHYLKYHVYCFVTDLEHAGPQGYRLRRVRVYRLPMPAKSYQPQTERGREILQAREMIPDAQEASLHSYAADFLESVAGHVRRELGFTGELIHSDPPLGNERGED